jgi:diguanylate cyclase (GGDEF)-like protein
LSALCAVAAAAERGLHVSQRGRIEGPTASTASVRDATFLNAMLPYALAQAHRHREPLTLICVEIDRLGAIYRSHGPEAAGAAVLRVAEAIAQALRGSDVIARLDDDRVIVVLPDAGGPAALNVAEKVRSAILGASQPTRVTPVLTASLGVACFPVDAPEMYSLLQAADDAMALAKARGGDQIAALSLRPPIGLHHLPKADEDTWEQRVG